MRLDNSRRSYEVEPHLSAQALALTHGASEVRHQRLGAPQAWRMEEPQPQPHPRRPDAQHLGTDVPSPDFPQGDEAMRLEITRLQQQVVQLETALLEAQGSTNDAPKRMPPSAAAGRGSLRVGIQTGIVTQPGYPSLLSWPSALA